MTKTYIHDHLGLRPQYANISLSRGQSSRPVMANSVVSGWWGEHWNENEFELILLFQVGPFNEGTDILLICESGGGKPIPQVRSVFNHGGDDNLKLVLELILGWLYCDVLASSAREDAGDIKCELQWDENTFLCDVRSDFFGASF